MSSHRIQPIFAQEKYQALVDLAFMTAILVREMTETSED
jgi:hypothetical protein